MVRCRGWGLHIRSAIALPGAMPCGDDAAGSPIDLDIAFGAPPLVDPGASDGPYRLGRDAFDFVMPGVARYLCGADRIAIDPAPGADPDMVAAMLIATAIPAWLWARGHVVLHAAAAILPGSTHAVVVAGASGSGKSTLLARAAASGARIVTDDSVCLRLAPDGIRASGLPGGYFAPLTDDRARVFHAVPVDRQAADAALGAIVVLDATAPAGRLTGSAAVTALLAHRHRPRIARLCRREASTFGTIAQTSKDIPIYNWFL